MPTETDTTLPPIHRVAVRYLVIREPISVGSQDYSIYIGMHAFARLRMLLTHAYIDKAKVSLSTLGAVPVTTASLSVCMALVITFLRGDTRGWSMLNPNTSVWTSHRRLP